MKSGIIWRLSLIAAAIPLLSAPVPYTAPDGDLNLDGQVNVKDIQCAVMVHSQVVAAGVVEQDLCSLDNDCEAGVGPGFYCRYGFSPHKMCLPPCLDTSVSLGPSPAAGCTSQTDDYEDQLCLGNVAKRNADLNCDGLFGNEEFTFLTALVTGKLGFEGSADHDGDGKLNFCDDDSDGDTVLDEPDCDPLNATVASCDDGNPCTDDLCDAGSCLNTPLAPDSACDDGNPCTTGDLCQAGECVGTAMVCQDEDPCTQDQCQGGQCVFPEIPACATCGGGCDDGDPCTSDTCNAGKCAHTKINGCTTCKNSCGKQSPYGCWCDEACFEFGLDCCMDVCNHCNYCPGKECGIDLCGNWCGWCQYPKECWAGGMCI